MKGEKSMKKEKELPMYAHIRGQIYGESRAHRIKMEEISACTGRIEKQTLYERLRKPQDFRLGELVAISNKLNMSLAELLGV